MTQSFVIAAPPYSTKSGGIMVLHSLCSELNNLGFKAGLALITGGSQMGQDFSFAYSADLSYLDPNGTYYDYHSGREASEIANFVRNSIAIYPDIIKGNPLGSAKYCTYVLGVPKFEIHSEFVMAFSKLYINHYDFLLFKPFIDESFTAQATTHWARRDLSLTYIGKGSEYLPCSVMPSTLLIDREWPKEKSQLALLLKNTKFFFSWDCVSATNVDAILCGAVPILLHDKQIPRHTLNSGEFGPYPALTVEEAVSGAISAERVKEIDLSLDLFREKVNEYNVKWSQSVSEFASRVTTKCEN